MDDLVGAGQLVLAVQAVTKMQKAACRFMPLPALSSMSTAPFVGGTPIIDSKNAARAVRGQVPTSGYLPPEVPTPLGTQPPRYLPP